MTRPSSVSPQEIPQSQRTIDVDNKNRSVIDGKNNKNRSVIDGRLNPALVANCRGAVRYTLPHFSYFPTRSHLPPFHVFDDQLPPQCIQGHCW